MSTGSNQLIRIKPSLVPYVWKGLVAAALGGILLVVVLSVQLPLSSDIQPLLAIASLGLLAVGLLALLTGVVRRNMYTYQITDSHIIIQKQLLRRSVRRIPFTALSDVEVSQSFAGRLARYGNIVPISKSGYGLVHGVDPTENFVAEMINVPDPDKVANLIMSRASLMVKAT